MVFTLAKYADTYRPGLTVQTQNKIVLRGAVWSGSALVVICHLIFWKHFPTSNLRPLWCKKEAFY